MRGREVKIIFKAMRIYKAKQKKISLSTIHGSTALRGNERCLTGSSHESLCPSTCPHAQDLHCHATNKLLCSLAVDCDGDTSIGIKCELQAVQDFLLPILLSRTVNIIFIPERQGQRIRTYSYEMWSRSLWESGQEYSSGGVLGTQGIMGFHWGFPEDFHSFLEERFFEDLTEVIQVNYVVMVLKNLTEPYNTGTQNGRRKWTLECQTLR